LHFFENYETLTNMLYILPTPVGNLEDITLRSLRLLKEAQRIITEDSRSTRKLLKLLEIEHSPKFVDITRSHQLNNKAIDDALTFAQQEDSIVVLVTDSGTPGISDPGREIVMKAQKLKLEFSVLPGATAFVPAVVASGLVSKEFVFLGFLPIKKGRQSSWHFIINSKLPVVLYESVHRIQKCVAEMELFLTPERKICICREISKTFETYWTGSVGELKAFDLIEKGEFVIVIDGV
jgi:16S rRNA (cytidine1402-2'-O)-methyltransferase